MSNAHDDQDQSETLDDEVIEGTDAAVTDPVADTLDTYVPSPTGHYELSGEPAEEAAMHVEEP